MLVECLDVDVACDQSLTLTCIYRCECVWPYAHIHAHVSMHGHARRCAELQVGPPLSSLSPSSVSGPFAAASSADVPAVSIPMYSSSTPAFVPLGETAHLGHENRRREDVLVRGRRDSAPGAASLMLQIHGDGAGHKMQAVS